MDAIKDKAILLRVPKELHTEAKVLSAKTGKPLQQVLEQLLREWVAKQTKQQAQK